MEQYQGLLRSTLAAASGDSSLHFKQLSFSHCTHILFMNSLLPRVGSIGLVALTIQLACCFISLRLCFVFVLFLRSESNLKEPEWPLSGKDALEGALNASLSTTAAGLRRFLSSTPPPRGWARRLTLR